MLNPNDRTLYTAALTPPAGMVFDEAIATTFSLDPTTLLTVPVHLAMADCRGCVDQMQDEITLLEAIKRVSSKITIFSQIGRIHPPVIPTVLYGMLEHLIVEVQAPRGGSFHPKLWLLRFVDRDGHQQPLLRLIILSRNLTPDRSWDISLHLEGRPGGRYFADNRELGDLVKTLPGMSVTTPSDAALIEDRAARLSDELRRTNWELPIGFESINFHIFGLKRGKSWQPPKSDKALLISPFCTDEAIKYLLMGSKTPAALISNPDTLSGLKPGTLKLFTDCYCLHEAAETEDGEDESESPQHDERGLHAKVYVYHRGWDAHLLVGSANATNAAFLAGNNVEVLVELVGKRSKTIDIEKLLSNDGLGEYITPFIGEDQPPVDTQRQEAEEALENAKDMLVKSGLVIKCMPADGKDFWELIIRSKTGMTFPGLSNINAWPITMKPDSARGILEGLQKGEASLGSYSAASITGLIAFELTSSQVDLQLRFVLNLPLTGRIPDRDAAIFRTVINNREGFLRYLMLLLGGDDASPGGGQIKANHKKWFWGNGLRIDAPLLEQLTQTFCRHPERLSEVSELINKLTKDESKQQILPNGFVEFWQVFERALEKCHE